MSNFRHIPISVFSLSLQGTVKVMALDNKPASNHKVHVALNWTASNPDVLDALNNGYTITELGEEKLVLIEVVSVVELNN